MQLTLRRAEQEDCDDLYKWRNDEKTRQASFSQENISFADHSKWLAKILLDSTRQIYIGEDESNNKIGMVRIDKLNEYAAEISVNVNSKERGHGYGAQLIQQACQKDVDTSFIMARTKKENLASIKAFKKAGFFEVFIYQDAKHQCDVVVLGKNNE